MTSTCNSGWLIARVLGPPVSTRRGLLVSPTTMTSAAVPWLFCLPPSGPRSRVGSGKVRASILSRGVLCHGRRFWVAPVPNRRDTRQPSKSTDTLLSLAHTLAPGQAPRLPTAHRNDLRHRWNSFCRVDSALPQSRIETRSTVARPWLLSRWNFSAQASPFFYKKHCK